MNIRPYILASLMLTIPSKTQERERNTHSKDLVLNLIGQQDDIHMSHAIFPTADILAQGNKYRHDIFQYDLLREWSEYLTQPIIFHKSLNTERTDSIPFPRTIAPLQMDLKSENLKESEREAFIKLRNNAKEYRDKYYNNALEDDEITRHQLNVINRWRYIIINPNHDEFEHNDTIIKNPQVMIIIDEFQRKIVKIPISLWKYGTGEYKTGYTPTGIFSIQTSFPVNAPLVSTQDQEKVPSYFDAVHSWSNSPWNWLYTLNKEYYEKSWATMVKRIITLWPDLEHIWDQDAEGNISWKQWIFIHGTNSLKARTFGKNASNGCIRIHPEHLNLLQNLLVFGKAYRQENGKRSRIQKNDFNGMWWNNKLLFEKIQRHDQNYFFTAGSLLYIMKQE